MPRPEIYISIDIETDGPAPGVNSMLALGAVAIMPDLSEGPIFYRKLLALPDARQHSDTMANFWAKNPLAWEEVNRDKLPAGAVMQEFAEWLNVNPAKKIAVAWPIAFDFAFVNYPFA